MGDPTGATRLHVVELFLNELGHEITPERLELLVAPNVVYRVPGHHKLSGSFSGLDEVAAYLSRLAGLAHGTFDLLQWEDRMVGDNYVAVLGRIQIQVGGRISRDRTVFVFDFDDRQRIRSIEVFLEDQDGYTVTTTLLDHNIWDLTRAKHKWPPASEAPLTWLGFLAWSASRRTGAIEPTLTWEMFLSRCLSVRQPEDDEEDDD